MNGSQYDSHIDFTHLSILQLTVIAVKYNQREQEVIFKII